MTARKKNVAFVVAAIAAVIIGIDYFPSVRVKVVSVANSSYWPHRSGIHYHLKRASNHYDALTTIMLQNPEYEAILAGGGPLFEETCILSSVDPECPASTDKSLIRHMARSGTTEVGRLGDFLVFGLGSTCVGETVFDYAVARNAESSDFPKCDERPEYDDKEVCFLELEDDWYIHYRRFDNPDYCRS